MVVYQGKNGSAVFYFENKIVGSLPLGNHTIQDYEKQRDSLLREALEDKSFNLKQIKNIMWRGLHTMKNSKLKKDNQFICMTVLCLMKLKQIDPEGVDQGILLAPRKKVSAV
jgi:hypothetical protein